MGKMRGSAVGETVANELLLLNPTPSEPRLAVHTRLGSCVEVQYGESGKCL